MKKFLTRRKRGKKRGKRRKTRKRRYMEGRMKTATPRTTWDNMTPMGMVTTKDEDGDDDDNDDDKKQRRQRKQRY